MPSRAPLGSQAQRPFCPPFLIGKTPWQSLCSKQQILIVVSQGRSSHEPTRGKIKGAREARSGQEKTALVAQTVKCLPAVWGTWVDPRVGKIPWRRKWQPTPVPLPRKCHGWMSLVGYSPRGRKRVRHDRATSLTHPSETAEGRMQDYYRLDPHHIPLCCCC